MSNKSCKLNKIELLCELNCECFKSRLAGKFALPYFRAQAPNHRYALQYQVLILEVEEVWVFVSIVQLRRWDVTSVCAQF